MEKAARRKPRKTPKDTSAVAEVKARQEEMTMSEDFNMFSLAATVLAVAVFVVPLTALSTCKYLKV